MPARVLVAPVGSVEAQCAALALDGAGVSVSGIPTPDVDVIVWFASPGVPLEPASSVRGVRDDLPLLVVCQRVDGATIRRAEAVGASGLIGWSEPTQRVVAAVERVRGGDPQGEAASVSDNDPLRCLTDRELQISRLLGEGASNAAIARALGISYHTARTHVAHVLAKLEVSHRYAVAALACRSNGFVALAPHASGGGSE